MSEEKNKEEKNKIVIVCAHCDDEIISCYEVIENNNDNPPIIIYMGNQPQNRRDEALKLKEYTNINMQLFCNSIPPILIDPLTTFYFPSPVDEFHPDHRRLGAMGESMLRTNKLNVIFYSVNMSVPYIHKIAHPDKKEELLNKVYPSQSNLWKYEKKYILFEGHTKWIV